MEHFISVYDNRLSPEICEEAMERFEAAKDKFPGLILGADGNLAVKPSKKRTMELIIDPVRNDNGSGNRWPRSIRHSRTMRNVRSHA